ncbi:ATP-binding protein [Streptomyces sp. NPDC057748]|uniref:ATP-binding protein n=1 Tax=unclassified Streptomyces TaxID=2593676 RepID=UPI0036C60D92
MSASGESPTSMSVAVVEARQLFPRHRRSAGRARAALRQQLVEWKVDVDGEPAETAVLLLSELVSNAVEHGRVSPGREIGTQFALCDSTLRVEVAAANNDLPKPRPAGIDDEDGRGLALVIALADRWGTCPRRNGIGKARFGRSSNSPARAATEARRRFCGESRSRREWAHS